MVEASILSLLATPATHLKDRSDEALSPNRIV